MSFCCWKVFRGGRGAAGVEQERRKNGPYAICSIAKTLAKTAGKPAVVVVMLAEKYQMAWEVRRVVNFGKPHIRADQLELQEAKSCFKQQYRSRNYLIRRWSEIGRNSCAQFVAHGICCVSAYSWENKPKKTKSLYGGQESNRQHRFCSSKRSSKRTPLQPTGIGFRFFFFLDNDAVSKMIMKGQSPTMRQASRTHRVNLDWLF